MTREEFIAKLAPNLRRSAAFREKQIARFPADQRNGRAATALEEFARSSPDDISADTWERLLPFVESDSFASPKWNDAVAETGRAVHFRIYPKSLDAFLGTVVNRMTPPSIGGVA